MQTKLKAMTLALSTCLALAVARPASAQISGDVVKIGLITDMTGIYADLDGQGGVEAVKMAIADFGGTVLGKKIEFIYADHLNKSDVASNKAREWFDQQGLDMLIGGTNSAAGLAMAKIAAEAKKPYLNVSGTTARLTSEECTPYTIHYVHDTVALARSTGGATVDAGGKTWFFITADYAFGTSLEKDTSDVVKAKGGKVLGFVRHPLSSSDFSSFLLQAQASKAEILGLANAGADMINTIKAANEFGITKTMKLAGLLIFINDIHAMGLPATQGTFLTEAWYWDLNDETRAWAKRFYEKMKRMPSMLQAGDYSAVLHYLNAVKAAGTDDGDKVMAQMKATRINDMFAKNGYIRPDGRMVHDIYLMQVKKPSESKYPWDYYRVVKTVPGEQAFLSKAESKCALWK